MTKQEKDNPIVLEKIISLTNNISTKKQLYLVEQIAQQGEKSQEALLELLISRRIIEKKELMDLDGILFEILRSTNITHIKEKLNFYFINGIVELKSSYKKDYQPLQQLLIYQKFQEADKFTQQQLCKLAGLNINNSRNWLYFTDISLLPIEDLSIIDMLWRIYSRGKFGFSIQRKIWKANDCNWEKLWHTIGWKQSGITCRYPHEFTWNINAPYGHLPLFNQLRGVQVLSALFKHLT